MTSCSKILPKFMFGLFRTFLACVVIIGHLHGPFQIGTYAVFGFYILSGYLMTTIMHGSYGYHASGRKRYVLNRLLIIYSTYWIAALLSLVCLFILGDKVSQFIYTIYFPSTISVWLKNFFLILTSLSSPRLSPATWALTVELFYYAMICIGISQTPRLSIIWLIGSLVYTGYLLFDDPANWASRYFPIPAASLPFAIGGCLYHFRSTFSRMLRATRISNPAIWTILICLNFYIFSTIDKKWGTDLRSSLGFYVNLVLIISTISACLSRGFPLVDKELDKFLGKFSYPAYLMHWQAGAIILALFSFDLNEDL